jgi:hypothetical protein
MCFLKKVNFFIYFKLIFLVFSDRFNVLISKINFLKIKKNNYFNVFSSEKYFEKQSLPQYKTYSRFFLIYIVLI